MSSIPDDLLPKTVSQNQPIGCSNSSIVKITVFVTALLLIGSAVACHIFQVNAIAVYITGAGGGVAILSAVIASIFQWCRTDNRAKINQLKKKIKHFEDSTENAKWIQRAQKGDIETIQAGLANNELLHVAASFGHTDLVDILLQKGANPKAKNARGYSAIHLAVCCEDNQKGLNTMRKLLEKDPSLAVDKLTYGVTPLRIAASRSSVQDEEVHKQKMALLIQYGAEVNAADDKGYTPLYVALYTIMREHEPSMVVIKFLVASGSRANPVGGFTPLQRAESIYPDWYQKHKKELSKLFE